MPDPKTFTLVTTATVERTYVVQAKDEAQAHSRLRTHLKDPEMLREGVVAEQTDKQIDKTSQQIRSINGKKVGDAVPTPETAKKAGAGKDTEGGS